MIDMGALASRIRPRANFWLIVRWWCAFFVLLAACLFPNPATVSCAIGATLLLLYLKHLSRQAFARNLRGLPCFSKATPRPEVRAWPRVALLVPARNEEDDIDEAARSMATLLYPSLDAWFVNDHSTDRTGELLERVRQDYPRVQVIHNPPVAEGWFGKSSALWHAYHQTDARHEWLLFADADVVFSEGIIEQAITLAEDNQLDFVTCLPKMLTKTWAEQLLLPSGWRDIVRRADYDRLNGPRTYPIGIGAFMLVKRSAYEACGGHKALANWHPEDALLAMAVKETGGRVALAWTPDLLRIRMYRGYSRIKQYTLRKVRMLYGERLGIALSMVGMRLATMVMPLAMMLAGILPQFVVGEFDGLRSLLAAAGFLLYLAEVREARDAGHVVEFHSSIPWLNPVSGMLRIWFALSLMAQILRKTPMNWRGREKFGSAEAAGVNADRSAAGKTSGVSG